MSYFSIVTPSEFRGKNAKADNQERMPVILTPVFGTMPFNRIINGTIANNLGLEFGKSYLVSGVFVDNTNPATGEVRQQLQVTNLGEITAKELALDRKSFLDQMGVGKVEPNREADQPKGQADEQPEPEMEGANKDDDKPF